MDWLPRRPCAASSIFAAQGHKDKQLPGIGAAIHETGERLFYARTEGRILATFSDSATFSRVATAPCQLHRGSGHRLPGHLRRADRPLRDETGADSDHRLGAAQPHRRPQATQGGQMTTEASFFAEMYQRFDQLPPGAKAPMRRVAEPDDLRDTPGLYRLFPGATSLRQAGSGRPSSCPGVANSVAARSSDQPVRMGSARPGSSRSHAPGPQRI